MDPEDFENLTLPPGEPDTDSAFEVDGQEPEVDQDDDELVTDPVGEPDEQEPEVEAVRQQSRSNSANDRIRKAVAEKKEAQAKADRLQNEMMELLKGSAFRQHAAPPPIDPSIERMKLEQMSDYDRYEYLRSKDKSEMQSQLAQISLQLQNQNDKSAFDALAAADPNAKRFASQVETRFQQLLSAGKPQTRDAILKYLIGDAILNKGSKTLAKAKAQGAANIRRQETRPTNVRSNVSDKQAASADDAAIARLKRFHDQGGYL